MAKKQRLEEKKIADISGYKIKSGEKAGNRIDRYLIKSDKEEGADCERSYCVLCSSKKATKKDDQPCNHRNITYRVCCHLCKEHESQLPTE